MTHRPERAQIRGVSTAVALELAKDLRDGPWSARMDVLEALATHAHEVADDASPEALAKGQRIEVAEADLPPGVEGLLSEKIYVQRGLPRDVQVLIILHELAHHMLRSEGMDDPHGDVWCLALALAAPCGLLEGLRKAGPLLPGDLAAASGVPWWAALHRLNMTAVI